MMDFLYRSVAPRYKGVQPSQGGGLWAGLRAGLLGGGTPVYRKATAAAAPAATAGSRRWWQAVPATPQYRQRPLELELDCTFGTSAAGCPEASASAACDDISDGVPAEIHIW